MPPNDRPIRSDAFSTENASLDNESVPWARILGIKINKFTRDSLHAVIQHIVKNQKKALIAHVNAHGLNVADSYTWFAEFLNSADYVFCDGHGVMLGARMLGLRIPEKITYADWLPELAEMCATEKFSLFLLGGRIGIAKRAADNLAAAYPGLEIVGTHHGYFEKHRNDEGNRRLIECINDAKPNILVVAFGMPLQESWLRENWEDIDANIALTAGAALDYASGQLRRPPAWMSRCSLEWLGRLFIEPRRLWRRYLVGNPMFILRICRELLILGRGRGG